MRGEPGFGLAQQRVGNSGSSMQSKKPNAPGAGAMLAVGIVVDRGRIRPTGRPSRCAENSA